jgi:hypothetical protein
VVRQALAEDAGHRGDVTTLATYTLHPSQTRGEVPFCLEAAQAPQVTHSVEVKLSQGSFVHRCGPWMAGLAVKLWLKAHFWRRAAASLLA